VYSAFALISYTSFCKVIFGEILIQETPQKETIMTHKFSPDFVNPAVPSLVVRSSASGLKTENIIKHRNNSDHNNRVD